MNSSVSERMIEKHGHRKSVFGRDRYLIVTQRGKEVGRLRYSGITSPTSRPSYFFFASRFTPHSRFPLRHWTPATLYTPNWLMFLGISRGTPGHGVPQGSRNDSRRLTVSTSAHSVLSSVRLHVSTSVGLGKKRHFQPPV